MLVLLASTSRPGTRVASLVESREAVATSSRHPIDIARAGYRGEGSRECDAGSSREQYETGGGALQASRTACVCVTRATCLPSASRTSVSTTIVVRPRCSTWETASTCPDVTGRKKFVFDSIVAVACAPSGRFRYAQSPPAASASPISAPPWRIPPAVHRDSSHARRARTSSGAACTSSMPSRPANGIAPARSSDVTGGIQAHAAHPEPRSTREDPAPSRRGRTRPSHDGVRGAAPSNPVKLCQRAARVS